MNGSKRAGVPFAVEDGPPVFDMRPTSVAIRSGPLVFGCFGVVLDGGVIACHASPWPLRASQPEDPSSLAMLGQLDRRI